MREQLNQKSIKYNWHEVEVSVLEGILARGDRKLCKVILDVYNNGSIYDAWSEFFDYDKWMQALEDNNIDYHFYTACNGFCIYYINAVVIHNFFCHKGTLIRAA